MRVDNHIRVRHIMLYHFEKGWKWRLKKLGKCGNWPDGSPTNCLNLNSDVHLAPLDRLEAAIKAKRSRKKNHIVFHHDNARPMSKAESPNPSTTKGGTYSSPPYSPTEAPTDYHVNHSLKNWQIGKVYNDVNELVADVKAWIASKDSHSFARGIDRMSHKWEAAIEVDGDYPPE
uniref:Uncharacterized protein n=1 Tax=Acrobeloides nanus TaxID=290746 RepID=A0A914CA75_9BILA